MHHQRTRQGLHESFTDVSFDDSTRFKCLFIETLQTPGFHSLQTLTNYAWRRYFCPWVERGGGRGMRHHVFNN